jgi:arsenate reductase (glutaredoxin)
MSYRIGPNEPPCTSVSTIAKDAISPVVETDGNVYVYVDVNVDGRGPVTFTFLPRQSVGIYFMAAMPPLTIYQKPTCTTGRKAVAEINERRELCRKLGVTTREILRRPRPRLLKHTDAQILSLMAANPGLIQRPILVRESRAVLD